MKKGYCAPIETLTRENIAFRHVLYTSTHMQLVLMSLGQGEDIGMEVHEDNDQFFRVEQGQGKVIINDAEYSVGDGDVIIVPAGSQHNIINTGEGMLKLYTIYTPAHHKDGIVRATKAEAMAHEAQFDGVTTE